MPSAIDRPSPLPAASASALPARPKVRLEFLDALRGMAALIVVFQHLLSHAVPEVFRFTTETFALGRMGVVVFFLISGFVIPLSLGRGARLDGAGLRAFWVGRFFRLYPAFWLSLVLVGLVAWMIPGSTALTPGQWAINFTMFEGPLGVPEANPAAWTLVIELLTYFGFSFAAWRGWLSRPVAIVLWGGVGLFLIGVVLPFVIHRRFPGGGLACLAASLAGYAVYGAFTGALKSRFAAWAVAGFLLMTLVGNYESYVTLRRGTSELEPLYLAAATATIAGYLFAGVVFALRERAVPRLFLAIGTVSYSLYLLHGTTMILVDRYLPAPASFGPGLRVGYLLAVELALSFALALFGYHAVERPANEFARSLRSRISSRPVRLDPERGPADPTVLVVSPVDPTSVDGTRVDETKSGSNAEAVR